MKGATPSTCGVLGTSRALRPRFTIKVTIMWSSRRYLTEGKRLGRDAEVLAAAVAQIRRLKSRNPSVPAILSLAHLAKLSGVTYPILEAYVTRSVTEPYRRFNIKKRSGGYRRISTPELALCKVQTWIAQTVLRHIPVHPASHAFAPGNSTVECAAVHCEARWLVKMDIADFFGSVTEIQAFRAFLSLGYNRLISLEMARLCTDAVPKSAKYDLKSWKSRKKEYKISRYQQAIFGRLPQGAPTSPMLSNLIMRGIDARISYIAKTHGLRYTRYSDDMTFSTKDDYSRDKATKLISEISAILKKNGLFLNRKKTTVVPPGAKKIVLGLLVDRSYPNLTREFKDNLKQHINFLEKFGIANHIARREFDSVGGAYRYLLGVINYANMVDPEYAKKIKLRFDNVPWPGTVVIDAPQLKLF